MDLYHEYSTYYFRFQQLSITIKTCWLGERNMVMSCVHSRLVLQSNPSPPKHTAHMPTMRNSAFDDKHRASTSIMSPTNPQLLPFCSSPFWCLTLHGISVSGSHFVLINWSIWFPGTKDFAHDVPSGFSLQCWLLYPKPRGSHPNHWEVSELWNSLSLLDKDAFVLVPDFLK